MDIKFYIALVQFFVSAPSNMKKMSECAKIGGGGGGSGKV